jgi:capsule biosynthesis phosphatase
LFLDNDSVTKFSVDAIESSYLSLGTFHTQDSSSPYSYVKVDNGNVVEIKEKVGISTTYCTGLYYFPSIDSFYSLRNALLADHPDKPEYFMSDLYALAIRRGDCVRELPCIDNIPLGTIRDIRENIGRVTPYSMRICFDIDNTILTNSERKGTHSGIEPIPEMVSMIRKLHKDGHTIVLNTARSMETCNSNPGLAAKRGMLNVLTTLERYAIPYDEIYFGKPWAHVYVDDRCWNQYTNPSFSEWTFGYTSPMRIERGCSNNQNTLYKKGSVLVKEGPASSLAGEIYYYKHLPNLPYFPAYYRSTPTILEIEFIEGQTLSRLFRNYLLTQSLVDKVFAALRTIHACPTNEPLPSSSDVLDTYIGSLDNHRKESPDVYDLDSFEERRTIIKDVLDSYVGSDRLRIVPLVHGDFWFENILVSSTDSIRTVDMRGKVGSTFTVCGDPMLDYAKLYQSILGFDFAIHNESYSPAYESTCREWLASVLPIPLDNPVLEAITACCILKSFFYFSDRSRITPVYQLLDKLRIFHQAK